MGLIIATMLAPNAAARLSGGIVSCAETLPSPHLATSSSIFTRQFPALTPRRGRAERNVGLFRK
jgi:hypothetical protein